MNVMGIYLKGDTLRIITLSGDKKNHKLIQEKVHKMVLPKDNDKTSIDMLKATIQAFIKTNSIERININGRNATGPAAGGPLSFKSEGFLLAITDLEIERIYSTTIRATDRKMIELKEQKPVTKDLGNAYDLAFEALP